MRTSPPIFIGGTNGSGTRVYAKLLYAAGVFQGKNPNFAFEPASIRQYTRKLVPELMQNTQGPIYDTATLPDEVSARTEKWIEDFARGLKADKPAEYSHWGWKHPRNLFLAPFLHQLFKGCFFVQAIRDGRDMSLAGNKGDFLTMNQKFDRKLEETPSGAACFWSQMNTQVADWATVNFGRNYICSRFEDLCDNPEKESRRILLALGLEYTSEVADLCANFVKKPQTTGRWHSLEPSERSQVISASEVGLRRFGYLD
ncbi:MAG: sulfotransferase [Litorimonas sp.]